MELRLTAIYKQDDSNSVVAYGWTNEVNGQKGASKNSAFVEWIERRGGRAYILNKDSDRVYCSVRVLPDGERVIQPSQEGLWTTDLRQLRALTV